MKSGKITYYLYLPVTIYYTPRRAERQTLEYPGCPASIEVTKIEPPTQADIDEAIEIEELDIETACWEDVAEREYPI